MTENENLKKVAFEADEELKEMLQQARAEGKRYGDKKFSNRLAYEIGVKVLMGLNGADDIEVKKQQLEEVRIKKAVLESEERFLLSEISRLESEAQEQEKEAFQATETIKKLAGRIKECWTKINCLGENKHVGFIATQFNLNKGAVEAVFRDMKDSEPTEEEALRIAYELMGGAHNAR